MSIIYFKTVKNTVRHVGQHLELLNLGNRYAVVYDPILLS